MKKTEEGEKAGTLFQNVLHIFHMVTSSLMRCIEYSTPATVAVFQYNSREISNAEGNFKKKSDLKEANMP